MQKKRAYIYNNSEDEFGFDMSSHGGHGTSRKTNHRRRIRMDIKRRMADHDEYLWKKRNGWFDEELSRHTDSRKFL